MTTNQLWMRYPCAQSNLQDEADMEKLLVKPPQQTHKDEHFAMLTLR